MVRRQKCHKKRSASTYLSPLSSTLAHSWVPLTLILLLYTSGLTIGESASGSTSEAGEEAENTTTKLNYTKTGNPQIDYIHDPNLPRELNGYNLSDYPFLNRVPSNINFSCEGLKDGFYASIEHKCQLYHHCLFGTRYDFLCANYTAFDQKTFICQFVSEIDCPNSALFFHRNDALYVTKTTTPPPRPSRRPGLYDRRRPPPKTYDRYDPPSTGGEDPPKAKNENPPPAPVDDRDLDPIDESEEEYPPDPPPRRKPARGRRRRCKNKRRCRRLRPRPRPVYYDDDYDDYEDDYYDYEDDYYDRRPKRRREKSKDGNKVASSKKVESLTSTERTSTTETTTPSTTISTTVSTTTPAPEEPETLDIEPSILAKNREDIFTKSRPPPRIRPPVPKYERKKYDFTQGRSAPTDAPSSKPTSTTTTEAPLPESASKAEYDEYYDNEDYQSPSPVQQSSAKPTSTTTQVPTTLSSRQRLFNRNLRPTPSTSTTARTTSTTVTTPSTTVTTSTTPRPTPRATTKATTTSTTTEAPQYEYEYEYEDELPPSSSTEKATTPTTTVTTTTTEKPSRNSFRSKRPQYAQSIQTSTSVTVQEEEELPKDEDDSQNAINRRRATWTRSQSPQSFRSTESVSTPNSITSTSERYRERDNRQQSYEEPVITVKAVPPTQQSIQPQQQQYQNQSPSSRTTEAPVVKTRPSRFWQRPAKVVASTTSTTEAPGSDYSDYSDEPEPAPIPAPAPVRYNNQNSRQKSPLPSSTFSYNSPQASGNSEASYNNHNYNPRGTQNQPQSYNSNQNTQVQSLQSQQYLRPTQNSYRASTQQSSPRVPDHNNYISPYGPPPSSMGLGITTSSKPEFISLLRDDEDPYYDISPPQQTQLQNPQHSRSSSSSSSSSFSSSRGDHGGSGTGTGSSRRLPPIQRQQYYGSQIPPYLSNSQKNLYGAAQETYHTFVPPPSRFNPAFMSDFGPHSPMLYAYRSSNPGMLGVK